jgi:hypothetical protein
MRPLMIFDKLKIVLGIIVFLLVALVPLWYGNLTGNIGFVPIIKVGTDAERCVENTLYMKSKHMDLLNNWKESVVRDGIRIHKAVDGRLYNKSLTGTCLGCHSSKAQFCDRCHDYAGVKPKCWDCHVVPKDVLIGMVQPKGNR